MRPALKLILILAIGFSLAWLPAMYHDFKALTGDADNWIGPDKGTDTLIHFFVTIASFLYLILQTIPACIGWILAFDSRKAAFGLLILPGFIGLIVSGAIFGLLYKFDPLWHETWLLAAIIGAPALTYVICGQVLISQQRSTPGR